MPFDTPLPLAAVLLLGLLLLCLVAWMAWRQHELVPRGTWLLVTTLRGLVVVMLVLLALNPYVVEKHPDPEGFRVALLADVSGSMHTRDLGNGQSRIDVVNDLTAATDDSLRARLESRYRLDGYTFAGELMPLPPSPLVIEPGVTAIGDSLEALLAQDEGGKRLAAAVLLSDGISLQGLPLMEAARSLRKADVPVTVVGIGERSAAGDVGLELEVLTGDPLVGEPLELETRVSNTFTSAVDITVETLGEQRVITRRDVTLGPGQTAAFTDTVEPSRAGLHSYRARLVEPVPRDTNQSNDVAFAAAEVSEPRVLRALYLSSHLSNNFRYLRDVMRNDPDWDLRGVIRINDERFAFIGFEEQPEEETDFTDAAAWFYDHSVLVVETAMVRELDADGREALRNFLTRRGGGILFVGAPGNLSDDLRNLLPVRETETVDRLRQLPLEINPDPVFAELAGGTLFRPPAVFLPEGKTAFLATELSRGGRVALSTLQGNLPVLSLHAYGAGRVAYLGTTGTWRWRMNSEHGLRQHDLFWRYLLGWLGTGGKPRLELPLQGELRPVGEPLALDVDVRGPDFRPAEDARVRATIYKANGDAGPEVNLVGDPMMPGRYRAMTTLDNPGEYRIDYRVSFPDGEELQQEAWFAGAYLGRENTDLTFRERELRDLARVTGGRYLSWREAGGLDTLNLSAAIPVQESRYHWTRNLTFLLLLLAFAGSEWIIRRRVGLT